MKYKKIFFSPLLYIVFLLSLSCSHLNFGMRKDMYSKIEDLHVAEDMSYPDSPFDSLVKETFSQKDTLMKNGGNHYLYILDIGDEALLSRIHLIRTAKKSIIIQTFIWSNDETGRYVAYELIEAAKRGVKIKIIVDQWRLEGSDRLAAYMATAHPNIEVKNYNPNAKEVQPSALKLLPGIALRFKQVNQRMHNKIFIIDDRIAITGGRNYENDYYDRGHTRNFKDRDVIVIGPVVKEMTGSFAEYWAFKLSINTEDLRDVAKIVKRKDAFKEINKEKARSPAEMFAGLDKQASDFGYIQKVFVSAAFKVDNIKFVYDLPGKNNSITLSGGSVAAAELAGFLSKAKKSIVMQTPYLVFDKKAIKNFKKLRKGNKDLDIMISSNSLAATDSIYAYAFFYKQKKLFVERLKFRIFELKPVPEDIIAMMPRYALKENGLSEAGYYENTSSVSTFADDNAMESKEKHLCVHAKSFVVDDEASWIGSFNVDPRSAHLNTEVGIIVYDKQFAAALKGNMLRDMEPQNSWTVGKRKDIPLVGLPAEVLSRTLQRVPVVDIWPFHHTSCFELKGDKDVVPFYHEDFYENYEHAGSFPGVSFSLKEIQIRLLKTFAGIATPII